MPQFSIPSDQASVGQSSLFDTAAPVPEGFVYGGGLVTAAEEAALIADLACLPFQPYRFRGFEGQRRVVYFGRRYDGEGSPEQGPDIPAFLHPLRDKAADFAGLEPSLLAHALVNEYRAGAPIGWHRDRPQFEDVIGVSLGASTTMRFRRPRGEGWERISHGLAPRSVYLLRGPARHDWQHSLPPAQALRYSVTFRALAPGVA